MNDTAATINDYAGKFGSSLCLRLHGEGREGMEERTGESWNTVVRLKDEELERISYSLKKVFAGEKVYIYVNNHYEGSAPLTIDKLTSLLMKLE
jgi:uncharacterized protein YecE (DUF72 family)